MLFHFVICHRKKCHRPCTSSCYKGGGIDGCDGGSGVGKLKFLGQKGCIVLKPGRQEGMITKGASGGRVCTALQGR